MRRAAIHTCICNAHIGVQRSVVIADFNIVCVAIFKDEADPPLVVDRDGVLYLSVALERVQPILRGRSQVIKPRSEINVLELASCAFRNVRREPFGFTSLIKLFRAPIGERLDHANDRNASRHDLVERPSPWHALELARAAILESKIRTNSQIGDGTRDEDLPRTGRIADPCRRMHGDAP